MNRKQHNRREVADWIINLSCISDKEEGCIEYIWVGVDAYCAQALKKNIE